MAKRKNKPPPAAKQGRYANVRKYRFFGETFDSKKEAYHYLDLRDRRKHGLIRNLEVHPRISIVIGGVQVRYPPTPRNKKGRAMVYVADFRYFDVERECTVVEDVKMQSGFHPEIYKFKRALLHTMGLTINEV